MNKDTTSISRPESAAARQRGKSGGGRVLARFLALEPRVLLDAAAVETAVKVMADAPLESTVPDAGSDGALLSAFVSGDVLASPLGSASGADQILFVDGAIEDYGALINELGSGVEVHVLQEGDWAAQIQVALARRDGDVASIHIVSHGAEARLTLGGDNVELSNLEDYSRVWSAMRNALSADGDILIYGCSVGAGERGAEFVQALSSLTGADVAASDDLSGVAALGGDWDLERSTGDVASSSLYADGSASDFMGVLADGWVQDAEITSGTSAVGITRTYDATNGYRDWKFVGTSGSNKVDIYLRNGTTGVWGLSATVTGDATGAFGYDIAAAGNRLVVSAPEYNNGSKDGRIYIYTWNGTNWTTGIQTIGCRDAVGSGEDGNGAGDGADDRFGFSVDMAWNGSYSTPEYRMIVGQPHEDWWNSNFWDWSVNERPDAGVAFVYSATTGTFAYSHEMVSQAGGTNGANHRFGDVVAAGYDADNARWWYAVGGTGLDQVRTYHSANTALTNAFAWDSSGPNDVSIDDDYMVIARSGNIQTYKLAADSSTWNALGAAFGGAGAVVMVDDIDPSATGDSVNSAYLVYSGTVSGETATFVAEMKPDGSWLPGYKLNSLQEAAVAIWRSGADATLSAYDEQQLVVPDISPDTTFTLSVGTLGTTGNITYSTVGATLATNIQNALNALIGTNAATVTVTTEGAADTLKVTFNRRIDHPQMTASNAAIAISTLVDGKNYSVDALSANSTGARSYHFNWDPDATDNSASTNEDTPVDITNAVLTGNDVDPNIVKFGTMFGDVLAVTAGPGITSFGATVTVVGGTKVTYDPTTSTYLQSLRAVDTVQETFSVTISDSQGGSTTQLVTVTVTGVNDAPTTTALTPLSPYAYQQSGSTNAYDFSSYFTDIDSGEASQLIPSATVLPAGWSAVADGTLLRVTAPPTATAGNYTITVRVQDPQGVYSGTRSFVIAIDDTNDAPFVQSEIPDQVALAGYDYAFTVPRETFGDPDPAPFDNLTYTATLSSGAALPAWLSFDPVFRTFTGSPAAGDVGSITVRVTADDNAAARGTPNTVFDEFTLTIVNPTVKTLTQFADGPVAGGNLGFSTAISEDGSWLAVGAPSYNNYGAVRMYQWNGTGWTYVTDLTPTTAVGSQVGWSVDLSNDGTKIIVGARSENGGRGAAYCYTRSASTFTLNGKLTANGATADDRFGSAVAINEAGNFVLIGASHFDYGGLTDSGAAFMAAFPAANGALTANVLPKDPAEFDLFGSSVAFDQNVLAVSAPRDDNAQGMVSRLAFDELAGNYAAPTFGPVGGTLSSDAQFFYDGARGEVVYLTGSNGMVNLSSPVDIGASWTVSAWYKDMVWSGNLGSPDGSYNTLTRGTAGSSPDGSHQIIINAGTNNLGVWNNSGVGTPNFVGAGAVSEQQRILVNNAAGNFTLTVDGKTTAAITYSATAATMATNVQNALNAAGVLGAGAVTVTVVGGEQANDTLNVQFNNVNYNPGLMTDSVAGVTVSALIEGGGYQLTAAQMTGWHHIVAVGEGSTTTFYIDGVNVGVANFKPTDDIAAIGNYQGGGQRFSNYLDDFRVYDRALSQSEIRNIYSGTAATDAPYGDTGSIYVFSTDAGNAQVAKLYAPDARTGDMVGWALDLDIYDIGGTSRQGGIIVASSIYNDDAATDGGAVYVWRSTSQASGAENNGGTGNGTWRLEAKLTSFDTSAGDYFGSDVAVDYNESTGGTRLLVGSQFEDTNGAYSGAVYAYKFNTYTDVRDTAGSWVPEKFASAAPQGGSMTNSEFFGSAVAIADTRAVIGARWRDTGGQLNDGAVYWANLLTQGNYSTLLSAETAATDSFFLPADEMDVVALDTTSTQGTISFAADGRMVYTPGAAFKTLGVGQSATDTFTYLTEQGGTTYTHTVTVTVHGVDDGLEAGNDVIQVSASSATLLNVLANDLDPDTAGLLSIRSLATAGTVGRVYNTGAALVYDPAGRFDAMSAGETVQEVFSYTVTNAEGQTTTAYVTLLVVGEDDPVVATNDAVTVKADSVISVNVLANDSDKDGADTFGIVAVDDSGALGTAVVNADGTISYLPGSAFRYLKAGETATDTIVYTVRDATGNESSALLVVTVVGVNDAPVAFNDGIAVAGGATVAVDVLANDNDPDNGTLRVVRLITDSTNGAAVLNTDGTISYTASAAGGLDKFSYEVIDSLGKSSIATVYINHPDGVPGVGAVDDVAVTRGLAPVSIALTANDGGGAQVTGIDATGGVGSVELGASGVLVYTPGESLAKLPAGTVYVDTISYSVQYADGSVGTATLRVYVNGQYVAPTVEDEDEERFALAESAVLAVEVPVLQLVAAPSSVDLLAPVADNVARMALAGMVEMAAAESAEQAAGAETPVQPEPDLAAAKSDIGKPGLSAALSREVLAKRAGVDALLRHFADHAA